MKNLANIINNELGKEQKCLLTRVIEFDGSDGSSSEIHQGSGRGI